MGYFAEQYVPTLRGFDTFLGYYSGETDYYRKNYTKTHNGTVYAGIDFRNGTAPTMNSEYSTWIYGNETLRLMERKVADDDADPFFIYLPFQAAHIPYAAPQDVVDQFVFMGNAKRSVLAAVLTLLDDTIGQIVDYLQSAESGHLWDDTMLIVSSDNGGNVGYFASNFPLRGGKGSMWEGGVKVNGFVNGGWLNDELRGTQMNALMHATDWFVTLQTIAGIETSVEYLLDGVDQTDNLLAGDAVEDIYSPRFLMLHNVHEVSGALRWREYKLIRASELSNGTDYGLTTKCHCTWCVNSELSNEETQATIQCQASGNYDHPTGSAISRMKQYNLFNIETDPCEYCMY